MLHSKNFCQHIELSLDHLTEIFTITPKGLDYNEENYDMREICIYLYGADFNFSSDRLQKANELGVNALFPLG